MIMKENSIEARVGQGPLNCSGIRADIARDIHSARREG
jgi:hypothetical protein